MQCVEFESRLNYLLDERLAPAADTVLAEHAGCCAQCAGLLAAHELLLEGVEMLPTVRLCAAEQDILARRVVADVGSAASHPFPLTGDMELAGGRAPLVAAPARAPRAMIWLALAAAAAILIALVPWFRHDPRPNVPGPSPTRIADDGTSNNRDIDLPLRARSELEPIAWVGFQVADRLKPVTNSMVTALRELRKRPLFRSWDEQGRSSYYTPRDDREVIA